MRARNRVMLGAGAFLIAVVAVSLGYFVGAGNDVSADQPPVGSPTATAMTFAVAGDSITAWTDRDAVPKPERSWTTYAGTDGVEFTAQGWAEDGARLAEIGTNMRPVDADALVVLAGTNDLGLSTTVPDRLLLVDAIVYRSRVADVIVCAVPPLDSAPQLGTEWNIALRAHASEMGWKYVDPWAAFRAPGGMFVPGTASDGIHPTPRTAAAAGAVLRDAIIGTR